jgi:hypothetical protein
MPSRPDYFFRWLWESGDSIPRAYSAGGRGPSTPHCQSRRGRRGGLGPHLVLCHLSQTGRARSQTLENTLRRHPQNPGRRRQAITKQRVVGRIFINLRRHLRKIWLDSTTAPRFNFSVSSQLGHQSAHCSLYSHQGRRRTLANRWPSIAHNMASA